MKRHGSMFVAALLAGSLILTAACSGLKAATADPKTEEQKTLYALGLVLGRNISLFNLTPDELEMVKAGLTDSVKKNKAAVEMDTYSPKVDALARSRMQAGTVAEKARGKLVADNAAKDPGAVRLPSGVVIRTTRPGTGPSPAPSDQVKVHYHGTLTDGTVFDSSVKRKEPATFPLGGVIPCWTQGVQKMKVGEKATLTCPSDTAYGDEGRRGTIPGGATLIFEVELLEILGQGGAGGPGMSTPPVGHPPH
jgi:FKBP-type peptidyl-prolyl cis-trans isomerase FkpA